MTDPRTRAHAPARWTTATLAEPCPRLASLVLLHAAAALAAFQLVRSF